MEKEAVSLIEVSPGQEVQLVSIGGGRGLRHRLTDMGLNAGVKLKVLHSHRPGPCVVSLGGVRLILGRGVAQRILVREF